MINFLTGKDVISIHDRMIAAYGGLEGYSDPGRIESMVTRILNRHVYEGERDMFVLAAAYLLAIARGHCFNDANKRTAFASAALFLRRNGVPVQYSADHEELTVKAAEGGVECMGYCRKAKKVTHNSLNYIRFDLLFNIR